MRAPKIKQALCSGNMTGYGRDLAQPEAAIEAADQNEWTEGTE